MSSIISQHFTGDEICEELFEDGMMKDKSRKCSHNPNPKEQIISNCRNFQGK
jgi:hypothetical protein